MFKHLVWIGFALVSLFVYGVILPFMISARDDFLVIGGVAFGVAYTYLVIRAFILFVKEYIINE